MSIDDLREVWSGTAAFQEEAYPCGCEITALVRNPDIVTGLLSCADHTTLFDSRRPRPTLAEIAADIRAAHPGGPEVIS